MLPTFQHNELNQLSFELWQCKWQCKFREFSRDSFMVACGKWMNSTEYNVIANAITTQQRKPNGLKEQQRKGKKRINKIRSEANNRKWSMNRISRNGRKCLNDMKILLAFSANFQLLLLDAIWRPLLWLLLLLFFLSLYFKMPIKVAIVLAMRQSWMLDSFKP